MPRYLEQDLGDILYIEDTDIALPAKLNPSMRYMHFKTIAKGGKAVIQSCRDRFLGRIICYKQLKPEFRENKVEQLRFLREARISALLQHPATIPTYDIGRDLRGDMYFTMKLVHGYTLREVLDYRERYDLGQMLNIVVQVAQALAYAHTHGVVHRDIKPENILVGPYGEVLLMDWGLAKVWARQSGEEEPGPTRMGMTSNAPIDTDVTGLGGLEGTVTYMSPEQLKMDPKIDGRSDIFSLGVVLYEVVTGKTPALAETVSEMQDKVLYEQPSPPSSYGGPVPPLLEQLIMNCLTKLPEDRPEDAQQVVRVLQELG